MIRINDLYQIDVLKCKSTKGSHIPTKYIIDALGEDEDDDDHNHAVRISMYEDAAQDLNNQLNEQLGIPNDSIHINWLPHKVIDHGESIEITTANGKHVIIEKSIIKTLFKIYVLEN